MILAWLCGFNFYATESQDRKQSFENKNVYKNWKYVKSRSI